MAKFNPVDPILNELGELLNLFFSKKDEGITGKVTPEVYERLVAVAIEVQVLKETLAKTMKEEGLTEDDINKMVLNPPDTMSPKDKAVLDKATRMKREIKSIYKILKMNEEGKIKEDKPDTAKKGKKKSKKTKSGLQIGFRKGWKRL